MYSIHVFMRSEMMYSISVTASEHYFLHNSVEFLELRSSTFSLNKYTTEHFHDSVVFPVSSCEHGINSED